MFEVKKPAPTQEHPATGIHEEYLSPSIEVVEIEVELGFAGSGTGDDFGNGGKW